MTETSNELLSYLYSHTDEIESGFRTAKRREKIARRLFQQFVRFRADLSHVSGKSDDHAALFEQWNDDFLPLLVETVPLAAKAATRGALLLTPSSSTNDEAANDLPSLALFIGINCAVITSFDTFADLKSNLWSNLTFLKGDTSRKMTIADQVATLSNSFELSFVPAINNETASRPWPAPIDRAAAAVTTASFLFVKRFLDLVMSRSAGKTYSAACDVITLLFQLSATTNEYICLEAASRDRVRVRH